MYNMDLRQFKYAVEVSQKGSINKAAESLYMSQPNLSRAIKEMEAGLGFPVFVRSARGMIPTPEGEEFLKYAGKILTQVDELEAFCRGDHKQHRRFSITVPRASYISSAFVNFTNTVPKDAPFEIIYQESNASAAIRNILELDYKLGIIRYAAKYDGYFKELFLQKGLACRPVLEFTYELIMSKNHPLAEQETIRFSDLKPFTEIAHADTYVPSLPMSALRKTDMGEEIEKRIFVFERSSQFELLCENPDTFMWVSAIPIRLRNRYELVQRSCADNAEVYQDMLICREGYQLSELDQAFLTQLELEKARMRASRG